MTIDDIERAILDRLPALTGLDGTVKLDLGADGAVFLDARGETLTLSREDRKADCVIRISASDMTNLIRGRLNPLVALAFRRIRIEGDRALAEKMGTMLRDHGQQIPAADGPDLETTGSPSRPLDKAEDGSASTENGSSPEAKPGIRDRPPGGEASQGWLVASPVHQRVAGRLRLRVLGLKGAPHLATRLESELAAGARFRSVSASATTGRVLLLFDPRQDANAIMDQVKMTLAAIGSGSGEKRGPLDPDAHGGPGATPGGASDGHGERRPWHAMTAQEVLEGVGADPKVGLSADEARRRLALHGANALRAPEPPSNIRMLLEQFASLPVGLLGLSAAISIVTGGAADAAAIAVVLGVNAVIGYATERQAERTIRGLARRAQLTASVRRNGGRVDAAVEDLVPGDLLVLSRGEFVGADARLIGARDLTVDESMLTGESLPARKSAVTVHSAGDPLSERRNMVYKGTVVTGGSGLGVVVATGGKTEIGIIGHLVGETKTPETPIQRQLGAMGRLLAYVSGGICVAVLGVGVLRGYGFVRMLKSSTALAVAAVPEGLPAVATTTLALGIREMRRQKVLIRRLDAVETLGSVSAVCFDKTGTLTANRMTVTEARTFGAVFQRQTGEAAGEPSFTMVSPNDDSEREAAARDDLVYMCEIAALCNEARLPDGEEGGGGSATEMALLRAAATAGVDVEASRKRWPITTITRRSETSNIMITDHEGRDGSRLTAVKGAPGEVLARCKWIRRGGERFPCGEREARTVTADNNAMAAAALRVLGVAYDDGQGGEGSAEDRGYTWLGLVGMSDPLRPGMRDLMRVFQGAGLRTIMITGDQSVTAYTIARELDLNGGGEIRILDSTQLENVASDLLAALTRQADVFARVSPANKLHIVQGLQRGGHVVAMTGDGINDGPALKAADVGVAMGSADSDVAHELADVVLEDDSLETMAQAVSQGRTIYANIRKSLHFLLATNLSEVILVSAATALGKGQALSPTQLLWINLVSDIVPGIALSLEPSDPHVLGRPPRDSAEPILKGRDLSRIGVEGALISGGAMMAYARGLARYGPGPQASTMAFHSLTAAQLFHALSCRSNRYRALGGALGRQNSLLAASVFGSVGATALLALFPPLRRLLGTAPLAPVDWLVTAAGAVIPFIIIEAAKPWLLKIGGDDALTDPSERAADPEGEEP